MNNVDFVKATKMASLTLAATNVPKVKSPDVQRYPSTVDSSGLENIHSRDDSASITKRVYIVMHHRREKNEAKVKRIERFLEQFKGIRQSYKSSPKLQSYQTRNFVPTRFSSNNIFESAFSAESLKELREKELSNIIENKQEVLLGKLNSQKLKPEDTRLIKLIIRLYEQLDRSMKYVRIWLYSPHPDLGNRTPASYLLEGKPEAVEILIHAIETGQPL